MDALARRGVGPGVEGGEMQLKRDALLMLVATCLYSLYNHVNRDSCRNLELKSLLLRMSMMLLLLLTLRLPQSPQSSILVLIILSAPCSNGQEAEHSDGGHEGEEGQKAVLVEVVRGFAGKLGPLQAVLVPLGQRV